MLDLRVSPKAEGTQFYMLQSLFGPSRASVGVRKLENGKKTSKKGEIGSNGYILRGLQVWHWPGGPSQGAWDLELQVSTVVLSG